MKHLLLTAIMLAGVAVVSAQEHQEHRSNPGDVAMAGYFGNSMIFRDQSGKPIEILYYRPDRTVREWRDGEWAEGTWTLNNGQDSSIICQTRDFLGKPFTFCHPFAPNKKVGDHWVSPEKGGGHPVTMGGIPVVNVNGKWVIADAPAATEPPKEIVSLEAGLVPPPAGK